MHPYATDSSERTNVPFYLAGLAIAAAWAISLLLKKAQLAIPWWAEGPSVLAYYLLVSELFETKLWRVSLLHRLRVVRVPVLEGCWRGQLTTSFDEHASKHDVEVQIQQSWTRIVMHLHGKDSKSHSLAATLVTESAEGVVFSYQYRNEPLPYAKDTMQIHYGTARLVLTNVSVLEGEYYSGRGRQNFGSIHLERE